MVGEKAISPAGTGNTLRGVMLRVAFFLISALSFFPNVNLSRTLKLFWDLFPNSEEKEKVIESVSYAPTVGFIEKNLRIVNNTPHLFSKFFL